MRNWIYQETSYKKVIQRLIAESTPSHGMISRLADSIGCQRSYLSQVLHSKVHLNKDQLWSVNRFFALEPLESRYFELLFEHERASSSALIEHLETQMNSIRLEFDTISSRFQSRRDLGTDQALFYYASWIPLAIHILTSIPVFQSVESLSRRLGITKDVIVNYLKEMLKFGLVSNDEKKWKYHGATIFLPKNSPFVAQNHFNWRIQAVEDSRLMGSDGLHYTIIQSISKEDYLKIRALIIEAIDQVKKIGDPSDPQILVNFNLDFYQPKSDLIDSKRV